MHGHDNAVPAITAWLLYWDLQQAQPPWGIGCGPRHVLAFNNGHGEALRDLRKPAGERPDEGRAFYPHTSRVRNGLIGESMLTLTAPLGECW